MSITSDGVYFYLDEVRVAVERLAGVAEVTLLASQLPDEKSLVAGGGHDHVLGISARLGIGGGGNSRNPAVVGLQGSTESE